MSLTVVLAVGLDSSLVEHQSSDWKSAGYGCGTTPSNLRAGSKLGSGTV